MCNGCSLGFTKISRKCQSRIITRTMSRGPRTGFQPDRRLSRLSILVCQPPENRRALWLITIGQGQGLGQDHDLNRSLRKKAHRDSSIRSEYMFGWQPRPASYHQGTGQFEDLKWPPSPSSTGATSYLDKYPERVFLLAIGFVLHPSDSLSHRFKSAKIKINVDYADRTERRVRRPKIIKYAPHLISGAVSNATLNWTFNLTGSLGISQGPANASITPSAGYAEKAVLSRMMKIQGSTRTTSDGVEDGELLWSFEENPLQKSGLPREFTFVMLIQVPRGQEDNVDFQMEIEPVIDAWYGSYPQFWQRRCYQPLYKAPLNFQERIGQRFFSCTDGDGTGDPLKCTRDYNFATMDGDLDDMVQLPGTTYSIKVRDATSPQLIGLYADGDCTGRHPEVESPANAKG